MGVVHTKGRQMANKKNTWAGEERARGNLEAAHNIQKNVESLIDLMKNDKDNYSGHLKKAQNIQENLQSLIDLTLKIQSETQAFTEFRKNFKLLSRNSGLHPTN